MNWGKGVTFGNELVGLGDKKKKWYVKRKTILRPANCVQDVWAAGENAVSVPDPHTGKRVVW